MTSNNKTEIKRILSFQLKLVDSYIQEVIGKCKQLKNNPAWDNLDVFRHRSIYPLYAYIFVVFNHMNEILKDNGYSPCERETVFNIRSAFAHPEVLKVALVLSMDGEGSVRVVKKENTSNGKAYPHFEKEIITFKSKSGDGGGPWYIEETYIDQVRNGLKKNIDGINFTGMEEEIGVAKERR
jgi:hypothetical protein